MKGYKFYLEFESSTAKRKNKNMGTVVAVSTETPMFKTNDDYKYEAFVAVYDQPDSPVSYNTVSVDYLRERCKRISKEVAEVIHPQLFNRLNS